jgi:hypothetical protein
LTETLHASTVDINILATDIPERRLVLKINLERMIEPILVDIVAEIESSRQGNVDVLEAW